MFRPFTAPSALVAGALLLALAAPAGAATRSQRHATASFDHVFVLMMENQSFDNLVGRDLVNASGNPTTPDTPFITNLATTGSGLSTLYFGVTHPSLPNYLSQVAGSYFGVQDDNPSCYAEPPPGPGCHAINATNLVDQLETAGMTWKVLEQSMPRVGFRGVQWPKSGSPRLYAQKHNPFMYFSDIASNPTRLANIVPMTPANLAATIASPPTFTYIVPDQCHDMHGTTTCTSFDDLLREGDRTVKRIVTQIAASPAFTASSVIFVVWDEDDYSSKLGCCSSVSNRGGGHTLMMVVDKNTSWRSDSIPRNHYSMLKTIEEGLGLTPLAHAGDSDVTDLFGLL
jgi:phosphatidylinositol-3-phosphatase